MGEFTADAKRLGFDAGRLAVLDDWMARNVETGRFSGCSALIARHGEIAHLSFAGLRSIADNKPYERDTIVRIYSMTKMITSVILMTLVEKGLVHLEAPVSDFIPEFSSCQALIRGATSTDQLEAAPTPTLHQLLTHTSGQTYSFNPGLVAELYGKGDLDFGKTCGSLEVAAKRIAQMPLAFQPGTNWEYSVGIDIIGRVIEVLCGKPLDQVFQEVILDPLGMADTSFSIADDKIDRFADCYTKTEGDPLLCTDKARASEYHHANVSTFSGGGGLVSTLDDYHKFGDMIRRGGATDDARILSPRILAFMRRNHLAGDIASMGPSSFAEMPMDGTGFGIGGAVALDPARARFVGSVGDFGWGGMASTYFWTDPVEDLSCIFFTQLIPSSSYPNRAEFKALVHAALVA